MKIIVLKATQNGIRYNQKRVTKKIVFQFHAQCLIIGVHNQNIKSHIALHA